MSTITVLLTVVWAAPASGDQTDVELDAEAIRAIAAARPPSGISPLFGVTADADAIEGEAPVGARTIAALCDPDEVFMLRRETLVAEVSYVLFVAESAWTVSFSPVGLRVAGPVEVREDARVEFVAEQLQLAGDDESLEADGVLGPRQVAILLALHEIAEHPASAARISAMVEEKAGLPATGALDVLEDLVASGWVRQVQSRPESLWEPASPAVLAALVRPIESLHVTRLVRERGAAGAVLFLSGEQGTLAVTRNRITGLTAPRQTAAASMLAQMPSGESDVARRAGMAAGAGDEIQAELRRGIFRLIQASSTRDAYGGGQIDTWRIDNLVEYQDTTGTGVIDFVKVDDDGSGQWTRSFVRVDDQWQPSNILDAFLEIEFKLPWRRSAYHPHNVQVLLNEKEIARLEDTLPEGFYRFQIRPHDVLLARAGAADNQVRLVSEHLRGGHYVVTTSFNLVFQLAAVSRYVIADSQEEADRILRESGRFTSGGVDAALYANEWSVSNPRPREGEAVRIAGLVRNLGGDPIEGAKLIVRSDEEELATTPLDSIPGADLAAAEVKVTLTPGVHQLTVHVDCPGDPRTQNNSVPLEVRCGGDDVPPQLEVLLPIEGARVPVGELPVSGTASDNVGMERIELSVNGGLWQRATPGAQWEATIRVIEGENRIRVRCVDTSGNATESTRIVVVP